MCSCGPFEPSGALWLNGGDASCSLVERRGSTETRVGWDDLLTGHRGLLETATSVAISMPRHPRWLKSTVVTCKGPTQQDHNAQMRCNIPHSDACAATCNLCQRANGRAPFCTGRPELDGPRGRRATAPPRATARMKRSRSLAVGSLIGPGAALRVAETPSMTWRH